MPGFRFIIIQQEDKEYVRDNIIQLILSSDSQTVNRQLNYAVECIARTDFPDKWPGLAEQIKELLDSEDESKITLGLESLKSVSKRFEFEYGVGRKPLEDVVNYLFPRIEAIVGMIQDNTSFEAYTIKYKIADILYVVNQINICDRYRSAEGFEKLMNFYQYSLECPIDDSLISKTEDTETIVYRKSRPEWKLKAVAMHFMFRIFQKYGNPELCDKEDKEISNLISNVNFCFSK